MKYIPPIGASDPNAPYITENLAAGVEGSPVPAEAIEHPMREIMAVIAEAGLTPDGENLGQLLQAVQGRFAGFLGTGQHVAYEADLTAIDRNSLYAVRKGTATGLPDDMPVEAWAFVHTMVMPGDAARTQLLWSVDDPDHPGWWRRRAAGAWGDWKGVGSGGSGMPIGMPFLFPGTTPPQGCLSIVDGPLLSRTAYPQLWAVAQASGNLITEAAWQAKAAVQSSVGEFSSGDGATTFRCPRWRDFARAAYPAGGRPVGLYEADQNKEHYHLDARPCTQSDAANATKNWGYEQASPPNGGNYGTGYSITSNYYPRTSSSGGAEARPKDVNWLPCIKAFDVVTNAGELDWAALAASLTGKVDRSDWTQSHGSNGWQKLPSGLIIQWGAGTACSGTGGTATAITNTFPIAFTTNCYVVLPVAGPTDDALSQVVISSKSATGFVAENGPNNTIPILYIAIGK